jgi:hypothetical protein
MSDSLTKREGSAIVTNGGAVEGYEDLDFNEDIILPRWRLVQPTSQIEGQSGQFNHNLTDQVKQSVSMIVLRITPSRVMFNEDRQLVCYSHDGRTGLLGRCAACPNSLWPPGAERPACGPGYTYIGMDTETEQICAISAQGASVKPCKLYHSALMLKGVPPWYVVTIWKSEKIVDTKGKYYVLAPECGEPTDEETRKRAANLARWVKSTTFREAEEPMAQEPVEVITEEGPGLSQATLDKLYSIGKDSEP